MRRVDFGMVRMIWLLSLSVSKRLRFTAAGALLSVAAGLALICLAIAAAFSLGIAEANGASTTIMDRVQGPYRMVVGIIPARPVIPQTHLAIQVFDNVNEELLRDTDVELHVSASGPLGASDFGPIPVLNEATFRYFEVDVPFDVIGAWDLSLIVSSERGEEQFQLPLDVGEPGAQIQWIWIAGLMVAIVAVGAWTWLTLQRRRGVR